MSRLKESHRFIRGEYVNPHPQFRSARVIPGPGPEDHYDFEARPFTTEQMDEHSDWLLSSPVGSTGA